MIRVGGSTEVEVKEKKDRVDDAMHATKAAVEEGIVPGGGGALLPPGRRCRSSAATMPTSTTGINIVLRALEAQIRQIAENSGVEGSIVASKVLENKSQTFGFDAQTEQYVDMLNAGIVDPAKVVRVAPQDAASVAGLMITTEAMVAETPKKKEPPVCRESLTLQPADGIPRASWVSYPCPFAGLGAVRATDRQPEQLTGDAHAYPAGQEQGS